MKDKIKFRDLSWPVKTSVVVSWFLIVFWILSYIIGFILLAAQA